MQNRLRYILMLPLAAVAIVGFIFVRNNHGTGALLITQQRQAQALTSAGVERVVRVAPDPATKQPGRAAQCRSGSRGVFRNPWSCVIHYPSGRIISYLVTVHADGSYRGDHEFLRYRSRHYRDSGVITGCCISIP